MTGRIVATALFMYLCFLLWLANRRKLGMAKPGALKLTLAAGLAVFFGWLAVFGRICL